MEKISSPRERLRKSSLGLGRLGQQLKAIVDAWPNLRTQSK